MPLTGTTWNEEKMDKSLEILKSVNDFYSQSFNQLVVITVAILAFAGVLMPIMISWYQKRIFKLDQNEIETKLRKNIKETLTEELNQLEIRLKITEEKLEEKLKAHEKDLTCKVDRAIGGVLLVQANILASEKDYINAYQSYISACESFISANDNLNLKISVKNVYENCLPNLKKDNFDSDDSLSKNCEILITRLAKHDSQSHYNEELKQLRLALKKAKSTPNQNAA